MDKSQAKKRIEELSKAIEKHNELYYVQSQPVIADVEYDALLNELVRLEGQYPDLKLPDSPSQRIGAKVESELPTVTHQVKMMSLDNTYSMEELEAWDARVAKGVHGKSYELMAELKVDGVSCALTYENGILTLAATRGDGVIGEDVTRNVKTIAVIPLRLKGKFPKVLEVRGEVYMERHDFDRMNDKRKKDGEVLFANPRNATSGALKLLDSRITASRKMKFFVHSFGRLEGGVSYKSQSEFLKAAESYGLPVNGHNRLCKNLTQVKDFCQKFLGLRETIPYEFDGVVIKVDDLKTQEQLGSTIKSPRWAVAFKFPAYQATTVIKDIVVQVGRTGVLTPVAELEPVQCAGVTISRATLHNFDEIDRLNVNVGDRVLLERAGDVIPKIIKVVAKLSKLKKYQIPKTCPSCGSTIVKKNTDEVAYCCDNIACPKQIERALVHFASRGAMDIEGLGEAVVVQLLDNALVKDVSGIYGLKKEDLLKLELFADKKADNLIAAIEASKSKPLSKLLFGLGINNIGAKAATVLAQRFGSIDAIMNASLEELQSIDDVGPVMAESIFKYFKSARARHVVEHFKKAKVNLAQPKRVLTSDRLLNKKFVFTGELEDMSRAQAGQMVEAQGGKVLSAVSGSVDYVVIGNDPGSKYAKAKELGVAILNQKQFKELVHG